MELHIPIPPTPDTLCNCCQTFDLQLADFRLESAPEIDENGNTGTPRKISLGVLSSIPRQGNCPLCRLAAKVWEFDHKWDHKYMEDPICTALLCRGEPFKDHNTRRILYPKYVCISFSNNTVSSRIFVPSITNKLHLGTGQHTGRYLSTREEKAHLIRQWIWRCDRQHGPHKDSGIATFPPVQGLLVIDVWNDCLVVLPVNCRYLALSYVWGVHTCPGARKSNIDLLKVPGGLTKGCEPMPGTIGDAIWLTHNIGERYLWVDLLCIVQDDNSNKHSMISSMDQIFLQASLTIVAVTGESADSGLFVSDPEGFRQGERISEELTLISIKNYQSYWSKDNWSHYRRAWTLQEQLLSKRQIIFVDGLVFFLCPQVSWREDLIAEEVIHLQGYHYDLFHVFGHVLHEGSRKTYDAFSKFEICVSDYVERDISYPSDIMNAFSGISAVLGRELGTPLLFGLPIEYFDWAVLWQSSEYLGESRRRNLFPSWSWAGWTDRISWDDSIIWAGSNSLASMATLFSSKSVRKMIVWQYRPARSERFELLQNGAGQESPTPSPMSTGCPPGQRGHNHGSNSSYLNDAVRETTISSPAEGAGQLKFFATVLTFEIVKKERKLCLHDCLGNFAGEIHGDLRSVDTMPPFVGRHEVFILSERLCGGGRSSDVSG